MAPIELTSLSSLSIPRIVTITMTTLPLTGLIPCSPSDADDKLYCVIDAPENCCTSGVGRITTPPRNIDKRQGSASIPVSSDTSHDYDSSIITPAKRASDSTSSQTPCQSEALCPPSTNEIITTSPTPNPVTLTANTFAFDGLASPTISALSASDKTGIVVGLTVAILLIIGLAAAASMSYYKPSSVEIREDEKRQRQEYEDS